MVKVTVYIQNKEKLVKNFNEITCGEKNLLATQRSKKIPRKTWTLKWQQAPQHMAHDSKQQILTMYGHWVKSSGLCANCNANMVKCHKPCLDTRDLWWQSGGAGGPRIESENECGQQKIDVWWEATRNDHFNQVDFHSDPGMNLTWSTITAEVTPLHGRSFLTITSLPLCYSAHPMKTTERKTFLQNGHFVLKLGELLCLWINWIELNQIIQVMLR